MKRLYLLLTAITLLFAGQAMAAPGLKVSGKGVAPTNSKIYANAEGRITTLVQSIKVENSGDVTLNPGDEGYSLVLHSYMGDVDLQTYPIPDALAPGEQKTYEIHWDFDFTPLDAAYTAKGSYGTKAAVWDNFRIKEGISNTNTYIGGWMDVYPYKASFDLVPENSGTEVDAAINFGFISKPTTLKYRIRATGAADVTVSTIEVPVGFTVAPATPFTVKGMLSSSSDNYKTIEITADPTIAQGVLSGDIRITAQGVDPKTYKLQAVAMAEGELYESFEVAGVPKGWIAGKNWDRNELNYKLSSTNNKWCYRHSMSSSGTESMLITPRLKFAKGGKMQFNATRISSYSHDTRVKVYWSPNRSDWTYLMTVDADGNDGAIKLPPQYSWGTYTIENIPEGEGYIGFEGLYIDIDDVYGGKIVDVDYDILIDSFTAPNTGKVNDRFETVLTVSNLLADKEVPADAYTVELFADGKLVDKATPVVIEGGKKNLAFNMGYTPHEAGMTEFKAVLKVGKNTFVSTVSREIFAETSSSEVTVGNKTTTSSNVPLNTWDKNSESQNLYTAEMLAKYGVKPGAMIQGVKFEAYDTQQKDVFGYLTLSMKNVDVTSLSASSPVALTESDVKSSSKDKVKYPYCNSGADNYYDFLDFSLSEPFVYDGTNLLIDLKSEEQTQYNRAYFKNDGSVSGMSIYKSNDNHSTFLSKSFSAASGLPVMKLLIAKDPARAIGKVTDKDGNGVADVLVSYTAGEVLYTGTTNADGEYDITIFRPEHEYTVTADNEFYPVTTADGTVKFENGTLIAQKNIQLGEFAAERTFNVTFHVTNDASQSMEGIPFSLRSDNFSLAYTEAETTLDADGNATLKCFGGSHTATFTAPGMKKLTVTFGINKDGVRDFNLSEDVKAPYGVEAELIHDVFTGANDVALSWDNEVAAFTEDFESYKPFAIEFLPWTGIDGDKAAPAQLNGKYDHSGELNYGQIINPYAVEPMWDLNNYWTLAARSGRQYLGFIVRNDGKALDDMAITPAISIGEDYSLRFYAKGSDRTNAKFTVGITEKTDNPQASDFVTISPDNYIEASYEDWTPVTISLADYAGKDVKIAIRCISEKGSFISMIDDVFVGRLAPAAGAAKPKRSAGNPNESFVITLDGETVGTTTDYNYTVKDIAYGDHTIGVQAKYVNAVSDVVTVPVSLSADDYVKATVTLKTNNGVSPEGMTVNLSAISAGDNTSAYSTEANADGVAAFGFLPKGVYTISIQPKDFNLWTMVNDFQTPQNVNAFLFETLVKPFNLTADPEEQADGTFNVLARWNQDLGFSDGFESYADFATGTFGNWKTLDLNEPTAFSYPISLNGKIITFPGCSTTDQPRSVAPMVFNPAATTPSMSEDIAVKAPEGEKLVIFQGPQAATADKWLISPSIEVRDDYEWSFLAKSYPTYPETIELLVSEEGSDNPEEFKVIDTVSPSYEEWTQYTIPVGEYAGKNVRFAIHCISRDGFIALVDDFKVGRQGGENVASVGKVKDYTVKIDGTTVDSTPENSYQLTGLAAGSHKLGILARYESGFSEMAELPFNLTSGISGVAGDGNANVRAVSGAILIDAAAGSEVKVMTVSGMTIASTVSDGTTVRIEASAGVYAVTVGKEVHKVIVR